MEAVLRGVLGITVLIGILYLCSNNKKKIDWKLVGVALVLQIGLGVAITYFGPVATFFDWISRGFISILDFTEAGSNFVFGPLIKTEKIGGFIFAVKILPVIIFFSALTSVLYYLGILQKIIYGLAWVMTKLMRLSGAESMAAAANVFLGQTEAPLVIKPYLEKMTKSEFMCMMVGGMATIAGSVLTAYIGFLGGEDEAARLLFTRHLLTASIMSAPAAILAAKMIYPETNEEIDTIIEIPRDKLGDNILDAISIGTTDGLKVALNVGAMLVVFTAFMAMANSICSSTIGSFISWTNDAGTEVTLNEYVIAITNGRFAGFNLDYLLGLLMSPIAWLLGTPSQDILIMGQLLGKKTVLNEFVAYADIPVVESLITEKTKIIATYALCGFANFASIGIQIGGIGQLAPSRRSLVAKFSIMALVGGTIACFLTATIAGTLFSLS